MRYVLEVIFPYVIFLYACDCISYLESNHILLTSWFGKKFQIKRSGFCLAGVLPASRAIVTHNLPIHCTPEGVYVASNQSSGGGGITNSGDVEFIAYEEVACVEAEGKNIKINEIHTIKAPSSAVAKYQIDVIKELKDSSRSLRTEKIGAWLQGSFDLKALKKTSSSHSRAFSIIGFLSTNLFLVVFLVVPSVLYTDLAKYANLDVLLICIAFIYIMLLTTVVFTVRRSYKSDQDASVNTLLSLIFSPVNAVHAISYLTRNLYFKFNYLALAAYFLPGHRFKDFIRKELLLMDHWAGQNDRQDWQDLWKFKKDLAYSLLDARGLTPDELAAAPVKQDVSALLYCPYCLTEYSKKRHNCIDCNVTLKEFEVDQHLSVL